MEGVSTNDFDEALQALFGSSVKGLSPLAEQDDQGRWESAAELENVEWHTRRTLLFVWGVAARPWPPRRA